jgi:hypothetical protein
MTVAWTGIAANVLLERRTAHNRFELRVLLAETPTSSIRPNSKEAEAIRKAEFLIWDEAPICLSKGKVMVGGGDFRQVLPIFRFANRSQLIAESLESFELWP